MLRLCYEHDVRLSVCNVGRFSSNSARQNGNRHMTGYVGVQLSIGYLYAKTTDPNRIIV